VVKDASQITVTFNDGREYPALLSGSDASTDLALLKIDEEELSYLNFGNSDSLEIGEWVVAIGTPFELDSSLTVGIVSAKGRQGLGLSPYEDYIQTDAAINPGNSGGPLLNLQGDVIGINTAIFSRSGGNVGIGFAIPSKMAQSVINQIKDNGIVKRGYLGIVLQPIDKDLADAFGLDKQEGLLVAEVMKDSPAFKGGLQQGDIILQSNRVTVKNVQKFRNEIALMNPGDAIQLNVLRDGTPVNLTIQLGSQNNAELATVEMTQKLGIEVDTLSTELATKLGYPTDMTGVVITKVKPGSLAAQAGLRPMQIILSVATNLSQQKRIHNLPEFEEAVQEISDAKKNHLILVVRQQNLQRYYTIRMN
jgi:serine protease Do